MTKSIKGDDQMVKPAVKPNSTILEPGRQYTSIVQAPAADMFYGTVAEVNPLGTASRICSFDCGYCDLPKGTMTMNQIRKEFVFPTVEDINAELKKMLSMWKPSWPKPSAISISGNGEPTLYPQIDVLMEAIRDTRDLIRPGLPIVLYSNAAQFATAKPIRAAEFADERIIKLDCSNDQAFKEINAPLVRVNLNKIISNIRKLSNVTIQSMFIGGANDHQDEKHFEEWVEILGIIKPKKVYIQTIKYRPTKSGIYPLPEDALHAIAMKLERRTSIKALVFVG